MKKMTKIVAGVMGLMFFCMLSAISYGKTAQAETVIPLGDAWTDGYWAKGDTAAQHQYQFTIPSDGKVTVTCQTDIGGYVKLQDKDYSETYNSLSYISAGSSEAFSEYLKAGTYGIVYTGGNWDEGAYKIKVKFNAVDCNVPEPNNDFVSATPISLNRLQMGVLTDTNAVDYFKIQLKSATTLKIVTTGEESRYVSLYNGDFVEIDSSSYYHGGTQMLEKYLSPGTYYIRMNLFYNDTPYTLKCVAYQYITNIRLRYSQVALAKGKAVNLLSSVTPNNATQKTLKWTTSDSSVATVSSTGRVTARGVGYANITAAAIDGSNIVKRATVIVKPAKAALKKITLSRYSKRQILIKAKTQKNVNYQYQYSKNKRFKKAKSMTSSYSSLTTSMLSRKKKYYVRVRTYYTYYGKNYYGAWSKAKSIRTKK